MSRIAVVSPNPDSQNGGVERFCHLLADGLRAHGHEAHVTGWPLPGAWDLVVTNGMTGGSVGAPRIHVFHGCWVAHTIEGDQESSRRWRVRSALSGGLREFRAARGAVRVAVSGRTAGEVRRFYRMRVHHVIPNAVDTEVFRPLARPDARARLGWPSDIRVGIFAGRPETRKQPGLAVAAAHAAGLELWSAGSGPAPGADRHLGVLEPSDLALVFAAADCVVAPSLYEGCSLTVLEALATATPLATSLVGWVPDLVALVPEFTPFTARRDDDAGFHSAVRQAVDARGRSASATEYVRQHMSLSRWAATWDSLVRATAAHP